MEREENVDYGRQAKLLDPSSIGNRSISIIGAGATGSHVALILAMMGWGNKTQGQGILKIFDGDTVAEHNICNQIFYKSHVGKSKVEAIREIIRERFGFEIEAYSEMVTNQVTVKASYIFLLTDTMASRKEIFEKVISTSFNTDLVIETRMGLRSGRIYCFNPNNTEHAEEWKKTLYSDEEAEVSACGTSSSIASTAIFIASLAVGKVVQNFNQRNGKLIKSDTPCWNEVQFSLYPEAFMLREFGKSPILAQHGL